MKISNFKFQIILIGLLFYSFIGLFLPHEARAQQARIITIVPPTVQQVLDPGAKAEGTMKVENDSADPITFKATVQDYIVQDKNGTPQLLPPNTLAKKYSAAAWIGVTPETFTVAAHQKQDLNYFLQVPPDARPGGHYSAVVFLPVNGPGSNGTGAAIQTEVGTLFYISVNGAISENAQVTKMDANPFQEYGPVTITTDITNFGDLHIKPIGYISIYDMLGRKAQTISLSAYNIFPSAAREYTTIFTMSPFLFGQYKATLLASYGVNGNLPLTKTIYFWVFPWKIVAVILLIMIAIVLLAIYLTKKKKKQSAPPVVVDKTVETTTETTTTK